MAYEANLKKYMAENQVDGEHLSFEASCHSVADAAKAVKGEPNDFVKNVCMIGSENELIVAIVKGEDNASSKKVGKALGMDRPRLASPDEILERTGCPCGGTPSFGFAAFFLIDPKVLDREQIYTGGGSERSLIKISSNELLRVNQGKVVRIRR